MNIKLATATLAVIIAFGSAAHAQGICVTCSQPNAAYACDIDGWDKLANLRKGSRMAQIACITDIAKRYGHGECSVRQGMVGPCMGPRHLVTLRGGASAPPQTAGSPPPGGPVAANPPVQGTTPGTPPGTPPGSTRGTTPGRGTTAGNAPPRTVVEMAGNAAKDTERQLEKAGQAVEKTGKAVGGAVSKTWRCITSLFSDC